MTKRQNWHRIIYITALFGIAVGLPLNKILLSISGLLLALNWLVEADFRNKLQRLKDHKTGLLLSLVFVYSSFTLFYSSNLSYGLDDLRIKLPLLLFPIVILSNKPLSKRWYYYLLITFTCVVFFVSSWNLFYFYWMPKNYLDAREMSLFGSHIRLSLMVAFSFFISLYFTVNWKVLSTYLMKDNHGVIYQICRVFFILLLPFFIFYTHKSEVLTGYFSLLICALVTLFWFINIKLKRYRVLIGLSMLLMVLGLGTYFARHAFPIPKESIDKAHLPTHTNQGGLYMHDTNSVVMENGYFIHYFVCFSELEAAWLEATGTSLNSEEQDVLPVLTRYMTSLGLRKDAEGFAQLSEYDIENIKKGIPSKVYANGGVQASLARVNIEIQKHLEGADPNGSTIQQRLEYWSAGKRIIAKNLIFGIGVGDVQDAFNVEYDLVNSALLDKNRLHTHQQFMTFWISGGLILVILFLIQVISTLSVALNNKSFLLMIFWFISTFSYFFEDTLETQVGATLVAFFLALLLKQETNNCESIQAI